MRCCSMRVSGSGGRLHACADAHACACATQAAGHPTTGGGFLAGFHFGGIARDMTDDVILQMAADELLMHTFRTFGEPGRKARERVALLGTSERRSPPQMRRQCTIDLQTLDQGVDVVGMVSTALATKLRVMAGRSSGDRPRDGGATNASSPSVSRMIMRCSSLAVRGASFWSSPGSRLRWRLIQVPLRANEDETSRRREFRLEGAEG